MKMVVGVGDMAVSRDSGDVLVTYSLGSCIGVTLYDPEANVGGLIHCLLPLSKISPEKAKETPAMYVDTGFVELLKQVLQSGADKNRLIVKVAGCGAPIDRNGRFKIGDRNLAVLRKLLWKNKLLISGEDVGGTKPRTMKLFLDSGETTIASGKEVVSL